MSVTSIDPLVGGVGMLPLSSIEPARAELLAQLLVVWNECSSPDWDGYGAVPVNEKTLRLTEAIVEKLPLRFALPDVGAEPDGHLTLEWRSSPDRLISISMDPNLRLHYAAVIGQEQHHGSVPYSTSLPRSILNLIQDVTSD
jgi:hypothetical protein